MPREQRLVFDEAAALYDRARPTYPAQLAEDVIAQSGMPPGGRILEVGSGTGKGTQLFASRGYQMLCLEPGPNMAALARDKFADHPNITIEEVTFEDWPLQPEAFDLLISAQAYHWVSPEVRWVKAAAALRAGAPIAIFGNEAAGSDPDLRDEFELAYAEHAPALAPRLLTADSTGPEDEIDASGLFDTVWTSRYRWHRDLDAPSYLQTLETQSDHRLLPEPRRAALFEALAVIIHHAGGTIRLNSSTHLFFARKRS